MTDHVHAWVPQAIGGSSALQRYRCECSAWAYRRFNTGDQSMRIYGRTTSKQLEEQLRESLEWPDESEEESWLRGQDEEARR